MTRTGFLLLLLGLVGCVHPPAGADKDPTRAHPVYPSQAYDEDLPALAANDPQLFIDQFDWQNQGPLRFLDYLVSRQQKLQNSLDHDTLFPCFTVWGTHRGWIRESDIEPLIAQLGSIEPCMAVIKDNCSFLPTGPSTVGREAAFLIQGFRAETEGWGYGGYPPALSSERADLNRVAIETWWRSYQKRMGLEER